ncbi:MAG: hypothetical protein KatS3mg131_3824 [Candidatus Tectimicrobiota bacterium]|nr:MAG: hypothetical protein KatS3mg131_3824 [Candidatus Tectomicrobia bacterium]
MKKCSPLETRLRSLEAHLAVENPILQQAVQSFRKLDRVARRLGLLEREASYATRVSWWPIIAVLGTYSAGKSTFINYYLGYKLQRTGNQAVDDKFTVICYSRDQTVRVLPGLALDADPRFPFYQISRAIDELAPGEGSRIDAYLQLKTCPSERLRGKILIDSPGFDADAQRTATLRLTNHIIDLSDLVLVFFDARHPEPGTMQDTLEHLVAQTIRRPDASKFLYILNQIDTTAGEDNPEDVVAAWQRALAQKGLLAGRFYRIYNPEVAVPIADASLRARFEAKRDADLAEIFGRMHQVEIERAYRVVALLDQHARAIEADFVPRLQALLARWRRRVLWADGLLLGSAAVAVGLWTALSGEWTGLRLSHPLWTTLAQAPLWRGLVLAAAAGLGLYTHFTVRKLSARALCRRLQREEKQAPDGERWAQLVRAFQHNTRWWRSVLRRRPAGWGRRSQRLLHEVLMEAKAYVQQLNDRFTHPAGAEASPQLAQAASAPETPAAAKADAAPVP